MKVIRLLDIDILVVVASKIKMAKIFMFKVSKCIIIWFNFQNCS